MLSVHTPKAAENLNSGLNPPILSHFELFFFLFSPVRDNKRREGYAPPQPFLLLFAKACLVYPSSWIPLRQPLQGCASSRPWQAGTYGRLGPIRCDQDWVRVPTRTNQGRLCFCGDGIWWTRSSLATFYWTFLPPFPFYPHFCPCLYTFAHL